MSILTSFICSSYMKPGVGHLRYLMSCMLHRKELASGHLCWYCKRPHVKKSNWCSKRCKKWWEVESHQVIRHNNRCKRHKYCRITYRNKCILCLKEEWQEKHPKIRISGCLYLKLHGWKLIPTMRTSYSSWSGDKIVFNSLLQEYGYRWIVYVKMYCPEKGIAKPIVVGKSGSLSVNASGCDLSFSTDTSHGPARKKLARERKTWYYDYIWVKGTISERKAYHLESKIMRKMNLFGS